MAQKSLRLSRGNADTGIANSHDRLIAFRGERDCNRSLLGRVLCGVVKQVGYDLCDPKWIAIDEDRIRTDLNIQRVSPAFDLDSPSFESLGDNRTQIKCAAFELELTMFDARDVEQVIRQPGHVL